MTLCAAYMCVYLCVCLYNIIGNDGLTDVEREIVALKVLRLNMSELYQHFNAASILQQMEDENIVPPKLKEKALSYTEKYAQNMAATCAIYSCRESPVAFLLSLCDKFKATGTPGQKYLATKLRSRKFILRLSLNYL